jgi:hypothetical protein
MIDNIKQLSVLEQFLSRTLRTVKETNETHYAEIHLSISNMRHQ